MSYNVREEEGDSVYLPQVYATFIREYLFSNYEWWENFIESKDLGLKVCYRLNTPKGKVVAGLVNNVNHYIIVNLKKWQYNKIKYEF